MSRNPHVESLIERVLEMRLSDPSRFSATILVTPRVKWRLEGLTDAYQDASSGVMGAISGLTTKYDDPSKLPEHDLFVAMPAVVDAEVFISRSDARRLSEYQVLAIRRQNRRFGFHLPRFMFHLLHPEATTTKGPDLLGGLQNVSSLRSPIRKRDVKRRLWLEQARKCAACGNQVPTLDDVTLDHSLPKAMHGPNTLPNLSAMCAQCNGRKSADLPFGLTADDERLRAYSLDKGLWRPPA